MKTKRFIGFTVAVALLSANTSYAAEVSGRMELTVTMPEVLVLYHYDLVNVVFTGETLTAGPDNDANNEIKKGEKAAFTAVPDNDANNEIKKGEKAAFTAGQALDGSATYTSDDLAIDTTTGSNLGSNSTISVTLKNAWAVRAISSDNVTLAVTTPNATLTNSAGGTIGVSNATLSATDIAPSWTPTTGDLSFDLDLSTATHSGIYSHDGNAGDIASEATDTFLLTLKGN